MCHFYFKPMVRTYAENNDLYVFTGDELKGMRWQNLFGCQQCLAGPGYKKIKGPSRGFHQDHSLNPMTTNLLFSLWISEMGKGPAFWLLNSTSRSPVLPRKTPKQW